MACATLHKWALNRAPQRAPAGPPGPPNPVKIRAPVRSPVRNASWWLACIEGFYAEVQAAGIFFSRCNWIHSVAYFLSSFFKVLVRGLKNYTARLVQVKPGRFRLYDARQSAPRHRGYQALRAASWVPCWLSGWVDGPVASGL